MWIASGLRSANDNTSFPLHWRICAFQIGRGVLEHDPNYPEDYAPRFVAYLDILGFSALTRQADESPDVRNFLVETIQIIRSSFGKGINREISQFSDAIVISAPKTVDGLSYVMSVSTMFFGMMLDRGILLRGGIAAGNFHHNETIMFGPALLKAYGFDRSGSPPHVRIHDEIVPYFEQHMPHRLVEDPWDMSPILHALYGYKTLPGRARSFADLSDSFDVPTRTAAMICDRATDRTSPTSVRSKWRWLQYYWNSKAQALGLPEAI